MTEIGKEERAVARISAIYAGDDWHPLGCEVRCNGALLCTACDEAHAEFICRLNNIYLPLFNRSRRLMMLVADLREVRNAEQG